MHGASQHPPGRLHLPLEQGVALSSGVNCHLRIPCDHDEIGKVLCHVAPCGMRMDADAEHRDASVWASSFAKDARANHLLNHMHSCTETCCKYCTGSKDAKIPRKCRFQFHRVVEVEDYDPVQKRHITRKLLRKGKELVSSPKVVSDLTSADVGRIVPVRTHPFVSSTSDVCQVTCRSNIDFQYTQRVVPDIEMPADACHGLTARVLLGTAAEWLPATDTASLPAQLLLRCVGVMFHAAHNMDYCMTHLTRYES